MPAWLTMDNALPVDMAEASLPHSPGKYAFYVKTLDSLPPEFRAAAQGRPIPLLLYVGKADVSLHGRVWLQECQHRSPGTFFRSVGAMLGYRSPGGGRNYEFEARDKLAIIDWIARHLAVAWSSEPANGSHRASEQELIRRYSPLLNLQGNPRKLPELERLRAICRAGAA